MRTVSISDFAPVEEWGPPEQPELPQQAVPAPLDGLSRLCAVNISGCRLRASPIAARTNTAARLARGTATKAPEEAAELDAGEERQDGHQGVEPDEARLDARGQQVPLDDVDADEEEQRAQAR